MSDPAGKPQSVKDRLNYYVETALGGEVINNWRINIMLLDSRPISTIRFEDITLDNLNYGRKTPEDGEWAEYNFAVYIHEDIDTTVPETNPIAHQTMDLAEDLIDYLVGIRGDSTERSTYKIQWIDNLMAKEVNPSSVPRNIYTISVTGTIHVQWTDS
jgi:hypothetical protein